MEEDEKKNIYIKQLKQKPSVKWHMPALNTCHGKSEPDGKSEIFHTASEIFSFNFPVHIFYEL